MKSENRPVAEKLKVPDNEKNVLMFSNDNLLSMLHQIASVS